jgi:hypothetical protein
MSGFTTEYSVSTPTQINGGSELPEYITKGKLSLAERYELEHLGLVSIAGSSTTLSGGHIAGSVSAVLVSDTAPSGATSGCLWYNPGASELRVYDGTDWDICLVAPSTVVVTNYSMLVTNPNTSVFNPPGYTAVLWNINSTYRSSDYFATVNGVYLLSYSFFLQQAYPEASVATVPTICNTGALKQPALITFEYYVEHMRSSAVVATYNLGTGGQNYNAGMSFVCSAHRTSHEAGIGNRCFTTLSGSTAFYLTAGDSIRPKIRNLGQLGTTYLGGTTLAWTGYVGSNTCFANFSLLRAI